MGTRKLKKVFDVLAATTLVAMVVCGMSFGIFKFCTTYAYAEVSTQKLFASNYGVAAPLIIADANTSIDKAIEDAKAKAEAERIEVEKQAQLQAELSNTSKPAISTKSSSQPSPRTITINGVAIPYKETHYWAVAPYDTAGLWDGSDSVSDGSYGYFIGHNPGLFKDVPYLASGSLVSVCDSTGASQTYQVIDVFDVSRSTYLSDIEARIQGHGESIVIQTCLPNAYRVVVAVSI